MYGDRVHQAVLEAKDQESGVTIHKVNEMFDDGEIVFQASCALGSDETRDTIRTKVRALEKNYPLVIEEYIKSM